MKNPPLEKTCSEKMDQKEEENSFDETV